MNQFNAVLLKLLRWTGWFLVPLAFAFILTGYGISGRYGMGALVTEQQALTLHKLLHLPLLVFLFAHLLPAAWLAMVRWGWIRMNHHR